MKKEDAGKTITVLKRLETEADFPQIQLTSVDHGACEKGKEAVDILLEQTKSERKRIVHMEYEPQLIIRLSTFNRKKSSSQ